MLEPNSPCDSSSIKMNILLSLFRSNYKAAKSPLKKLIKSLRIYRHPPDYCTIINIEVKALLPEMLAIYTYIK